LSPPAPQARFKSYSKFPPCYKDVAFWTSPEFSENNLCELVRGIGGDLVEEVVLIDSFTHPKTSRTSNCFRITYRRCAPRPAAGGSAAGQPLATSPRRRAAVAQAGCCSRSRPGHRCLTVPRLAADTPRTRRHAAWSAA
jgi:hypothetical protein